MNNLNFRSWPCADWYHVPSKTEWEKLLLDWWWGINYTQISNDLLLPKPGYRSPLNGDMKNNGSTGYYWTTEPLDATKSYRFAISSLWVNVDEWAYLWEGLSVRCFKNDIEYENLSCSDFPNYPNATFRAWIPTAENQTWQNSDQSLWCYYICKDWFSWNNCNTIENPLSICEPGLWTIVSPTKYWSCDNFDNIICTWTWIWYIISACNVWTNIAWTWIESYGSYIQFGKSDSNWDTWSASYNYDWKANWWIDLGSSNDWWVENIERLSALYSNQNDQDKLKMQWPCNTWYHIPTIREWNDVLSSWWWWENSSQMSNDLFLPFAWLTLWNSTELDSSFTWVWGYWSSSPNSFNWYSFALTSNNISEKFYHYRAAWMSVRCFRN